MSNSPIELLVLLGISNNESARNLTKQIKNLEKNNLGNLNLIAGLDKSASIDNIKKHITSIQSNLKDFDITLDVKSNSSNNKVFEHMDKQTNALIAKLDELMGKISKVNSSDSSSKKNPFSSTQEGAERALKSVEQLRDEVAKKNGSLQIVNNSTTGEIEKIVTSIKTNLGEIDKKVYTPKINLDGSLKGFEEVKNIVNSDIFKDFNIKLEQAKNKLAELGRQGKLSGKSFKEFSKELDNPNLVTIKQLDELVNKMKQVSQVDSHNAKWTNATNNIRTQANESIVALEKLRQQASNLGLDTKQIDIMISKMHSMSNIQIVNDAQMNKANSAFSRLTSQISSLKNGVSSFETKMHTMDSMLVSISNSGIMSATNLLPFKTRLQEIGNMNLPIQDKVKSLNDLIKQLNAQLQSTKHANKMQESMEKARREIEKLEASLLRTENAYSRTVNKQDVNVVRSDLQSRANQIPVFTNTEEVKRYMAELKQVENQIRRINSEAVVGGRQQIGIIDSIKQALQKMPIWLFSGGIYFGMARGLKDITNNVIELDTQMVNLTRVATAFQYEFDEVINRSIENVTALSGKLSDYLELVNEYARTGKTLDESYDLANTTQMLVNISDLDAKESMDAITAAMIAFNISAEESITIANKLNEIDNNFPVTSKILSDGMLKASATASTFGVSIDELLGSISAISASTRESGSIVGNSLKTIYARITNNQSAISALDAIGISMNNLDGSAKNASELIGEVASKWDSLSEAEQRRTSIGIAGIYQLSRFNALMLNYQMAVDATETSVNSYNSAMREQEKYNTSLQARLNNLSNAWMGFSNALGQTIVYDTIVAATSALEGLTKIGGSAGGSIVALSGSMGLLLAPLTLISTRLTGFTTGLIQTTAQSRVAAGATNGLTGSMWGLAAGTTAASTAFRSFLMVTGIGAGIALLTAGISYLISKFADAKIKAEEFETYMNKNTDALGNNKEKVDELLQSYYKMSDSNKETWSTEQQQKYVDIQNQLAELFPAIIDYVDENGNAHIKNKDAITEEIKETNKLIDAQKALKREQARSIFKETLGDSKGLASKKKTLEDTLNSKWNNLTAEESAKFKLEILKIEREMADASAEIRRSILDIADAFTETGISISSTVDSHINRALGNIDLEQLNPKELEAFAIKLSEIRVELNKAFSAKDTEGVKSANDKLVDLIKTSSAVKTNIDELSLSSNELVKSLSNAVKHVDTTADEMGDAGQKADELKERFNELKTSISYINGVLEDYQENNKLSASTILEIVDKYEDLLPYINDEAKLIEELTKIRDKDIEAAKQQLNEKLQMNSDYYKQNVGMLEAYMKEHFSFYNEDLKKFGNLAELKADIEKKLIEHLAKQWAEYYKTVVNYNNITKSFSGVGQGVKDNEAYHLPDGDVSNYTAEMEASQKAANEANRALQEAQKALEGLKFDDFNLDFTKIGTSLDKSNKKTKKETKESIYITDKFKQALEAVNLAIEKQQALQSKHPKHSDTYRKSLEAQLKLEREKLKLIQDQASALDKQIKSGKIAQTGNVTIGDGNSKTSTSKSTKLSGWGKVTDTYGSKLAIRNGRVHTGIDLASAKGTRLDSNVAGKVVSTGKTDLSGNYVKIKDDKGLTHFYGHLDKIVAKVGEIVKVGQQIGNVGSTGHSTGSHLHYEIKDSSGKYINPTDYAKAAQSMVVSSEQISSVVSNTTQSIDDAKSTLTGLQSDVLKSQQTIADLEQAIIESQLASFDFKRQGYDEILAFEEAKLKNVTVGTTQYNKTKEKQITILKAKQKVNNDELAYVESLIKSGNLSAITLEQMKSRTMELKTSIQALNNELGNLALDKIMEAHGAYIDKQSDVIDFEKNKINELDKNSARYGATLEKINTHLNRKIKTHEDTIKSIENEIKVLGLQGEALKRAKDSIQSLTLEMQNFKQEMSDNNYEIVVNIKTRYDEEIDDIQFEIDRSKAIQALYKEGSADYANEIKKQIEWQQKLVDAHDTSRKALQKELNSRDILPERIKEITELMEDETVAYWNAKRAVEELNESLEETRKKLLNDIADKFISALKNVYEEQRDMALEAIDDEMEAHEKAHNERIKQLKDEMDLFRKNIEEKLRLLDRQDAERSYNMEMDELEKERDKVVDQINLLSLDDSHEAKSKRKKLLEQLDKIDKDINEKRYQRDLELQKQGLNDLLEDKETELDIVEENYDKQNQATLDSLREQRKYWEQHYNDLLNNERKFAQIREDILNGHFDKVINEFEGHLAEMIATMPQLENTLNGTMQAVGTAIRQNVIDEIRNAMKALQEFQDMQVATNLHTDSFNPNSSKDTSYQGNTGSKPANNSPTPSNNQPSNSNSGQVYASLNKGDLQVLLGKFINDVVAPTFKAETKERLALKSEGERIAGLGRANSSQIPVSSAFNNEIGKLTPAQIEQLKSFIKSNSGSILGGNYTSAFNKQLASLDTGGMTKYRGLGNDGIGGKLAMLHPNEVVETPYDVDQLVKHSSILENIMSRIAPVISKLPTLSNITNNSNSKGDLVFNIGNVHNSNNRDVKDFVNEIGNAMRTKGMW